MKTLTLIFILLTTTSSAMQADYANNTITYIFNDCSLLYTEYNTTTLAPKQFAFRCPNDNARVWLRTNRISVYVDNLGGFTETDCEIDELIDDGGSWSLSTECQL